MSLHAGHPPEAPLIALASQQPLVGQMEQLGAVDVGQAGHGQRTVNTPGQELANHKYPHGTTS